VDKCVSFTSHHVDWNFHMAWKTSKLPIVV
jgi:hypothetical protein